MDVLEYHSGHFHWFPCTDDDLRGFHIIIFLKLVIMEFNAEMIQWSLSFEWHCIYMFIYGASVHLCCCATCDICYRRDLNLQSNVCPRTSVSRRRVNQPECFRLPAVCCKTPPPDVTRIQFWAAPLQQTWIHISCRAEPFETYRPSPTSTPTDRFL